MPKKIKSYPHFDPYISEKKAYAFAADREAVARHKFYPFLKFTQRWTKYAKKGEKGSEKPRSISYAARQDAAIFSHYREIISEFYEKELLLRGLGASILAYRKIPTENGLGGKSNIHFAKDAFDRIADLGNCSVICLDIEKYFDRIDHKNVKRIWEYLIGHSPLPEDHYKVFRAVTRYATIERTIVFERLGMFGPKIKNKKGETINGYLVPKTNLPIQICTGKEFRELFCDGKIGKKISVNYKPYGIPQGSPISDVLANANLIDFDVFCNDIAQRLNGAYYRYSDDILLIAPIDFPVAKDLMDILDNKIREYGDRLNIKKDKSSIFSVRREDAIQIVSLEHGEKGKNGIEYLGFRYDGKHIYIKDGTVSNLYRKAVRAAKRQCEACARRYPDKSTDELKQAFNYEVLFKKFLKVEDFGEIASEKKNWTFWTYARRAAAIMHPNNRKIIRQLKSFRDAIKRYVEEELEDARKIRAIRIRQRKYFIQAKPVIMAKRPLLRAKIKIPLPSTSISHSD